MGPRGFASEKTRIRMYLYNSVWLCVGTCGVSVSLAISVFTGRNLVAWRSLMKG